MREEHCILHATDALHGGIATYIDILISHQSKSRKVVLVGNEGGDHEFFRSAPGSYIFESNGGGGRTLLGLLNFGAILRASVKKHDPKFVFLHSTFAGFIGRIALVGTGAKLIYIPNGWAFSMSNIVRSKSLVYAAVEWSLQWACDSIVAVSKNELELAQAARIRSSRLVHIYSGLNASEPRIDRVGEKHKGLTLVFVGRDAPQKGLDWLVQFWLERSNLDISLRIVGANEPAGWLSHERIKFLGWQSSQKVVEEITRADAMIMPSRWEAFGFSAMEAMTHGVPVIASARGALPELIDDGQTGYLFDLDDASSLERVLASVTRESLVDMGALAQKKCAEAFSEELFFERTERLLSELQGE